MFLEGYLYWDARGRVMCKQRQSEETMSQFCDIREQEGKVCQVTQLGLVGVKYWRHEVKDERLVSVAVVS